MKLDEIIADKTSGSNAILEKTIQALISELQRDKNPDLKFIVSELKHLFNHHPNFAVLFHFINSFFPELERNQNTDELLKFIADYRVKWSSGLHIACQNMISHEIFDGKKILLHSNSSAIHLLFHKIRDKKSSVVIYQTLSGPGGEGKVQAEILSKLGFEVKFIHENAAANFMDELDLVIFGADLITEDYFVNKAGTFQLSLLFEHYKKPVYVIADSRKMIPGKQLPEGLKHQLLYEKEKPPEELWKNPPENVHPVNFYFEKTPLSLISGFSTEDGIIEPNEIVVKMKQFSVSDWLVEDSNII
jgi:translation initiation factor 2B subunit (eIF-2B alpha/beta/delta family)